MIGSYLCIDIPQTLASLKFQRTYSCMHFTEKNSRLITLSDRKTKNSKSVTGFQSLPIL